MDNSSGSHAAQSAPMLLASSPSCVNSGARINKKWNDQEDSSSIPSITPSKSISFLGLPPILRISTPTEEDLRDDFTPPSPPVIHEQPLLSWPPRLPVLAADSSLILDPHNARDNATRYAVLPELALPIYSFRLLSNGSFEIFGTHYDRICDEVLIGDYTPLDWGKELLAKGRRGLEMTKAKGYPKLGNSRTAGLHSVLCRRVLQDTSHTLSETDITQISNPRAATATLQLPETILAKKDLIWKESCVVIHHKVAVQMLAASALFISHASDLLSNFPVQSVRPKETEQEIEEVDFMADHLLGDRRIWVTCLDHGGLPAIQMERTRFLMNARSLWIEHGNESLLRSFCNGRKQTRNDLPLLTQYNIHDKTASSIREALKRPLPFEYKHIKPLTRAKSDPRDEKESRADNWFRKRPSLRKVLKSERIPLVKDLKPKTWRKGKQIIRKSYVLEPKIPEPETKGKGTFPRISPSWEICLACRDAQICIDEAIKKGKPVKMGNSSSHLASCSSQGMFPMRSNKPVNPCLINRWLGPGRPLTELERKKIKDRAQRNRGRVNSLQDLENTLARSSGNPPTNRILGSEVERVRLIPLPQGTSKDNTSDADLPANRPTLPRFNRLRSSSIQPTPTPREPAISGPVWLENESFPTSFETMDLNSNNPPNEYAKEADEYFATASEDQSNTFDDSEDHLDSVEAQQLQHPYFTAIELIEKRGFEKYIQDDSTPSTAVNLSVSGSFSAGEVSTESVSPPLYEGSKVETREIDPKTVSFAGGQ